MANVISDELNAVAVESLDDIWLPVFVRNHPFLDRLSLKTAGGTGYRIPVNTGPGGGASGNFEDSLANSAANGFTGAGFTVPPAIVYGNTRIQWQDQVYSATEQSPVDIALNSTKNATELATENLCNMLLGSTASAAGSYAVIGTATNTSGNIWDLVLTVRTDAAKFNIGQVIVSKDNATAALNTGSGEVIGVNPLGGIITVDVGATGMTPTATEIIGLEGQLPTGSDTTGIFPDVFRWVPPAANRTAGVPTVTTFLGVTRSASSAVTMVSGWGWDGTQVPIFQAVYGSAAYMQNASKMAKPNTLFVNPLVLPKMAQECDTKVRYDMGSTKGVDVEFAGFTVVLPTGKCDVLAEPSMPVNQMLLTKSGTWVFAAPGGKIFRPATNGKLIIDSFDGNQSRCSVMATGFFGCEELSSSAVITVGSPSGLQF